MVKPWNSNVKFDIRVLYDGECSLCKKEIDFLRAKDNGRGMIDFVDVSDKKRIPV